MHRETRVFTFLAVFSLIYTLASVSFNAVPSPAASAVTGYAGLNPFRPITTPLWGLLIQLLSHFPGLSLAAIAATLHALIGAISLAILARILLECPYRELLSQGTRHIADDRPARIVAAVAATIFLASSAAFQTHAFLPQPDALGLPFLAAAWLFFQRYILENKTKWVLCCAAALSIGAVESASVALAAPVFAIIAVVVLAVRRQFTPRFVARVALTSLLGLGIALIALGLYFNSDVAQWREAKRFADVTRVFRQEYMAAGPKAIPRQGWLIILLFAFAPLPLVFSRNIQQSGNARDEWGISILRAIVLPLLALLILFELPGAPLRIAQTEMPLLTPYAATALWFGRLAGLLFLFLQYPPRRTGERIRPPARLRTPAVAFLTLLTLVIGTSFILNFPRGLRQWARQLNRLAKDALTQSAGGGWLLTDGALDQAIQLLAEREVPLLNLNALRSRAYQRFLHLEYGFPPVEWFSAVGADVVLTDFIRAQTATGRPPVALSTLEPSAPGGFQWKFSGLFQTLTRVEESSSVEESKKALTSLEPLAQLPPLKKGASLGLARYADWLKTLAARAANEMGVDLYRAGAPDDARRAFELALAFSPDHLSALLNLRECRKMAGEGENEEERQRIQQLVRAMAGSPIAIRAAFGRLIGSEAAIAETAQWLMLGFDRRALESGVGAGMDPGIDSRAYDIMRLISKGEIPAARNLLEDELEKNPQSIPLLRLLFRLNLAMKQFAEAQSALERLRKAGFPKKEWNLESARLAVYERKLDRAFELVDAHLRQDPASPEALLLRTIALAAAGREEEWRKSLPELQRASANYPEGLQYLASQALANRDTRAAEFFFERLSMIQPGARYPLEVLLKLALAGEDPEKIEARARALLALDPDDALGWYGVGVALGRKGNWELAADAFEKSHTLHPTAAALNDWAWALHSLGRPQEAFNKAKEACAIKPDDAVLWATYGKIAFDNGQLEVAAEAFERSRKLARSDTALLLTLLESYVKLGDATRAHSVRADLIERIPSMTDSERATWQRLTAQLPAK